MSLGPGCLCSTSGSVFSARMTGRVCGLGLGFLPVKGVRLWGEHGSQGAEKGEQNSLKTSLLPASEMRAEGLEGCGAVWPVDMGSRGERGQRVKGSRTPELGQLTEMALRPSLPSLTILRPPPHSRGGLWISLLTSQDHLVWMEWYLCHQGGPSLKELPT